MRQEASAPAIAWQEDHQTRTLALNVGGRYMALAFELALGMVMLPFNTRYLGASEYGLWMLAASIVAYFPILDLGYCGAMERFVAHYRARREAQAINEITSTLVVVFSCIGLLAFAIAGAIAWNLGTWFDLNPAQARTGAIVMLLVTVQFAIGMPFAIFGGVVNGFQRAFLNANVGVGTSVAVAIVNVVVLTSGGDLVQLVAATTATRMLGYLLYRRNAYRVFPLLRVRMSQFRMQRLREMTGFSVYLLLLDISNKINYATDPIVIAAVLTTGAVAVWTVAQRLADVVLQLTNQLNFVIFPVVVDCDTAQREDRLRQLLVQGTRLSLATSLPVAGSLILFAAPVVVGWTGREFIEAAAVLQILALVVLVRVAGSTAATVLTGGGHHQLVAGSNFAAAMVNIVLSILLIRVYGLPGVAFATLVPVTVRVMAIVIPAACRRVGISLTHFVAKAIWPAAWPAVIAIGGLALLSPTAPSIWQAVLRGGVAGLVYAVLFLGLAIGRQERQQYVGKLRTIARPALEAA